MQVLIESVDLFQRDQLKKKKNEIVQATTLHKMKVTSYKQLIETLHKEELQQNSAYVVQDAFFHVASEIVIPSGTLMYSFFGTLYSGLSY